MTEVSWATAKEMLRGYTTRHEVGCITIATDDVTFRFVNDTLALTRTVDSVPTVFEPFPCQIQLPGDQDDQLPTAVLSVRAVDRTIVNALRAASPDGALVTFEVVSREAPDVVDFTMPALRMQSASSNGPTQIDIKLGLAADFLTVAWPGRVFSRGNAGPDTD